MEEEAMEEYQATGRMDADPPAAPACDHNDKKTMSKVHNGLKCRICDRLITRKKVSRVE